MKIYLLSNLIFFYANFNALAQSQWKFPIAFEDASGAKDTIWYIWDSTATSGIDTALGEGKSAMDPNVFNVFTLNFNPDSTKTHALPFLNQSLAIEIKAINYQHPITISWDSSLFGRYFSVGFDHINIARIYNDYFFFIVNNDPGLQAHNMLLDNQVVAPWFSWGPQSQFPMTITITRDPTIGMEEFISWKSLISISPNPFDKGFKLEFAEDIKYFQINSLVGNQIFESYNVIPSKSQFEFFSSQDLLDGMYIINFTTVKNQSYHEKIIKISKR